MLKEYIVHAFTDAGEQWWGPYPTREEAALDAKARGAYRFTVLTRTQAMTYRAFRAAVERGDYPEKGLPDKFPD